MDYLIFNLNGSETIFRGYDIVLAPASFGHLAGVDVDSAPEGMWTPCRRT
jgi:hypothetical protein